MRRFLVCLAAMLLAGLFGTAAMAAVRSDYNMPYTIEIDVTNQVVTVYRASDNTVVRQMLCSSGKNGSTPLGEFYMETPRRASERTKWYTFYNYDGPGVYCYAKYASRIHNSILFHSLTYSDDKDSKMNSKDIKAFGTPASHGCIRLLVDDAQWIAENCLPGTYVNIHESGKMDTDLREILYVASFTGANGMSYERFMGISDEEGALGRYSEGEAVQDLQTRMRDLGYYDGEITGSYGVAMLTAVKQLQADLGLDESGVASLQLQEVIYSEDAPISSGLTLTDGFSGPVVRRLQEALTTLGVYDGPVDSVYDVGVAEAVSDFQCAYNYPADGVASPEIQQAVYYEIGKMKDTFGSLEELSVEVEAEYVDMATVVSETRIIIRERASTSSDELGKVKSGDTVFILEKGDDWTKVMAGSVTGYMRNKYLEFYSQKNVVLHFSAMDGEAYTIGRKLDEYASGAESPAEAFGEYYLSGSFEETDASEVPYVTVNTGSDLVTLNLRAGADAQSEIINQLDNGTQLRALSKRDGWTLVACNGQMGYLMNDYLEFWQGRADALDPVEDEDDEGAILDEEAEQDVAYNVTATVYIRSSSSATTVKVYSSDADDAQVIGELEKGIEVDVVKNMPDGEWVLISYKGRQGYMKDDNLRFKASEI